jgi:hypothetical protein
MEKKEKSGSGSKKIEYDVSKEIHQLSRNNEKLIKKSKKVGCFYCLKVFSAKEIKGYRSNANKSAVCPFCSTDSIMPDHSITLTEDFLRAMRDKWFNI